MTETPLNRRSWVQILAAWLVLVALLGGWYALQRDARPLLADSDDAMRMVTAMDLLGGQAWQDLTVTRDNAPFGASMHWSRLVDAPIAALTSLLGPNGAAIVWPLLLLLPLLIATRLAIARLVPQAGTITIAALLALNLVVVTEFAPGRVDHHNVQIVLLTAMLAALLLGRRRAAGGALAGLLAATCLAIGIETIAIVLAGCAAMALCWLLDPLAHRAGALGFAAGLAGGAILHLLLATPLPAILVAACDVLSVVYVTAAVLGSAALAGAVLLASTRPLTSRIGTLALLGIFAVAATAALFPHCLGGPYADVDPRMLARIFPGIAEARPIWQLFASAPATALLFSGSVILAVVVTTALAVRAHQASRQDWLILLMMLCAAVLMLMLQVRSARLAAVFALPAAAWLVTIALEHARTHLLRGLAALALAWIAAAPLVQFVLLSLGVVLWSPSPSAAPASGPTVAACRMADAYTQLAALPPGIVAAPVSIASHVLRYTPHAVVSAGFHRNGHAVIDNLDFFEASDERAREIADARGVTYAATCGEHAVTAARPWTTAIATDGPLRLHRLAP